MCPQKFLETKKNETRIIESKLSLKVILQRLSIFGNMSRTIFILMDWMSMKWCFLIFKPKLLFYNFDPHICFNRRQWDMLVYFYLKGFSLFIYVIYLVTHFYIVIFCFLFHSCAFIYLLLLWVRIPICQEGNLFHR